LFILLFYAIVNLYVQAGSLHGKKQPAGLCIRPYLIYTNNKSFVNDKIKLFVSFL